MHIQGAIRSRRVRLRGSSGEKSGRIVSSGGEASFMMSSVQIFVTV